ncbi:MAG: DUF819 family protein [Wenzhouxiangellaceae bacterium]
MLEGGFTYLALLVSIAGVLTLAGSRSDNRLFTVLPPIVILYLLVVGLSSAGVWQKNEAIDAVYYGVKDNLLPAMIFLMLLKSDLRQVRRLGARLVGSFFAASSSIAFAFIVVFVVLGPWLGDGAWKAFAALCGSWMGGTGNMVAIQGALGVDDTHMGYVLLVDSIDYAIWVALLLALVPYATRFNGWTGASTAVLDDIGARLDGQTDEEDDRIDAPSLLFLLGASLLISAAVQSAAALLPVTAFLTGTTWTVLIVTALGVAAAMTRLGRISGSTELSTVMLYVIVALIASRADLAQLTDAPLYIAAGLMILAIHAVLMVVLAKLFRLDLFTCGVASLANIGGIASAPILAAAYSRVLIPVGVLMALLGYVIGTAGGLLVARVLFWLS